MSVNERKRAGGKLLNGGFECFVLSEKSEGAENKQIEKAFCVFGVEGQHIRTIRVSI